MTAGYSGTPLAKKLGIEQDAVIGSFGAPPPFRALLEPFPEGAALVEDPDRRCDVLIVFAATFAELQDRFAAALELLPAGGGLWAAWPKRSSGVPTELDFGTVQAHGLDHGLVDNKVCAIDATWSGLRFVVRKSDRHRWPR